MKYFSVFENFLITHKKNVGRFLFIGLTFWALLLLHNRLQFRISESHVDERLTLNSGIHSMYTGKIEDLRVGESTRWLARMVYPIGLFYMNSHMGGEHYVTGWDYPSGNYVLKHYNDSGDVGGDPNIQDMVFAMKFVLGALVILSFLLAAYMMSIRFGYIAGLSYFSFALTSLLVNDMLLIFYTESTMMILFNLILAFAFTSNLNTLRLYIWLAFIFAFALSAKLTGIAFLLPVAMILKGKEGLNWGKGLRIEAFVLLIVFFVWLIHIYVISYMSLLDQTLANIYHYKTGHYYTQPSGMYQLNEMFKKIPVWVIVFPVAFGILAFFKMEYKKIIIAISIAASIILLSSLGMSLYMERNLTTPLVMIIFMASMALSLIIKRFANKTVRYICLSGVVIYFGCCCIDYYRPINESCVGDYATKFKKIALIDVSKEYYPNAAVLKSMPDSFIMTREQPEFIKQFLPYECVVIKRIKNNKHYTNYILPMGYYLILRIGNYFVFQQKNELKALLHNVEELKKYTPVKEGKYKIYHINNTLILYRSTVMENDAKQRFYMHIYPVNSSDVNKETESLGCNGNDFNLPDSAFVNGEVYLTIPLPNYPIKSIGIGQFNNEVRFWNEIIPF